MRKLSFRQLSKKCPPVNPNPRPPFGRSTAHATVFPSERQTTLTWFFDGVMDRAENYDTLDLALARADHIRGVLERDGWSPAEEP